jgi:hypothetical protein
MPMPEAPVYKHHRLVSGKDNVWRPRKIAPMQAEAVTQAVK